VAIFDQTFDAKTFRPISQAQDDHAKWRQQGTVCGVQRREGGFDIG